MVLSAGRSRSETRTATPSRSTMQADELSPHRADDAPVFGEMEGRRTDSSRLQQAELAEALGGLNDRGLGLAWAPAELLLGAVVVDRQRRRVLAGRLVGCDMFACRPEVVSEDLCQPQPGNRRAVRQQQVTPPG